MSTTAPQRIRAVPFSAERPGGPIDLDQVESPAVRAGIGYWRRLRGDRLYPSRQDISPAEIRGLLRNVVLLRVIDQGEDYEYRIVGDAHVIAHGFSIQGKNLSQMDEYAPGYGAVLKSLYDHPVRERSPLGLRGWLARGDARRQYIYAESVFLPLGEDDETVDHVLNFSVYIPHGTFE